VRNYYESRLNDEQRENFRENLRKCLTDSYVVVEFEKSDGTMRVMNCSLLEVPQTDEVRPATRTANPDVCRTWEVGTGWRSFRYDRILSVKISPANGEV